MSSSKKYTDQIVKQTEVMNAKIRMINIKLTLTCIDFLMH